MSRRRPVAAWVWQLAADRPGTMHEVILDELRSVTLAGSARPGVPINVEDVARRFGRQPDPGARGSQDLDRREPRRPRSALGLPCRAAHAVELVQRLRRDLWTLGLLGALIGPLFGILIADYYLIRGQKIVVDDLFTLDEDGAYYYRKGYNPAAIQAVAVAGAISLASVILPKAGGVLTWLPRYGWFVGCGVGFLAYYVIARASSPAVTTGTAVPVEAASAQ